MSFHFSDGQSVIYGDFSKLENLIKNLNENHSTDVGVFANAKTPEGKQIAEYGAYNEFGSITVKDHPPKRSFIRMPIEQKQDDIISDVEKNAKKNIENGNIKAIFEDIGSSCESQIQKAFGTKGFGTWRPNAPSTIKKKGSDSPLIDKGLLRAAITHRTK